MSHAAALKLFKCLADNSRLQIIKSLMKEDMYVERLAERLGLSAATISFHLKKLEDAAVVTCCRDQYYMMYSLCRDILDKSLLELMKEENGEEEQQLQREEEYRKKVIASFFEYDKLKTIPAQRKKERIILEEIAKSFETDIIYSETEVNTIIGQFHDDYCTLRRDMVDEGILIRNRGRYRKKSKL